MLALLALLQSPEVSAPRYIELNRLAADVAYDPSQYFDRDYEHNILEGRFLGRDGQYPQYAVAVRYGECVTSPTGGCTNKLLFRLVRSKEPVEPPSSGFVEEMLDAGAQSQSDARAVARRSKALQWLETDSVACEGSFEKVEAVRKSSWTPPVDYRLAEKDDDEIWIHVPTYEVNMSGLFERLTYRGPPYGNSPSGGLIDLIETLESCWRPSQAKAPWFR